MALSRPTHYSILFNVVKTGQGHKKNNQKKWRAEEEEKHKGLLTTKKTESGAYIDIGKSYWRLYNLRPLKD
jgi:hypothetical protein